MFKACLDDGADTGAVRIGLEVENLGLKQDAFLKFADTLFGFGRYLDTHDVAAHAFNEDLMLHKLGLDLLRIGGREVAFIDRHDDRLFGGLGVADGLDRLRHDAVVGGNHQNDDVGDVRAPGAHFGEGCVTGGVKERDFLVALDRNLIGADMLGDAAGLAGNDVSLTNGVEKGRLAVIDVAHDGHDGRTGKAVAFRIVDAKHALFDIRLGNALDRMAEFARDEFCRVGVDGLGCGHHHAKLHEFFDNLAHAFGHAVGKLLNGDGLRDRDLAELLDGLGLAHGLDAHALGCAAAGGKTGAPALGFLIAVEKLVDGDACAASAPKVALAAPQFGVVGVFVLVLFFVFFFLDFAAESSDFAAGAFLARRAGGGFAATGIFFLLFLFQFLDFAELLQLLPAQVFRRFCRAGGRLRLRRGFGLGDRLELLPRAGDGRCILCCLLSLQDGAGAHLTFLGCQMGVSRILLLFGAGPALAADLDCDRARIASLGDRLLRRLCHGGAAG